MSRVDRTLLVLVALTTVCVLGWVLNFSRYGLDITDEGFYLAWISHPFSFQSSITQFGYIYHVLYELVGQDLVLLRQANILITYGLGCCLAYAVSSTQVSSGAVRGWSRIIIASGYGTASLLGVVVANSWLPTPSYNTLAVQSLMITAIGLLLARRDCSRASLFGWSCIAIGGWLAFMAKPSTAAALAVCVVLYLLFSRKVRFFWTAYLSALVMLLLVCSSYVIDGSLAGSLERLNQGRYLSESLGGGHTLSTIWRLEELNLQPAERWWLAGLTSALLLWGFCGASSRLILRIVALVIAFSLFVASLVVIAYMPVLRIRIGPFQYLLIWAVPAAAIGYAGIKMRYVLLKNISISLWLLAVFFVIFPYIYAFGTNGNYWRAMGTASVFWIMAGFFILCAVDCKKNNLTVLILFSIAIQTFVVLRLHAAIEHPYRQSQPLFMNDYLLSIRDGQSDVMLEKHYGEYLTTSTQLLTNAGFMQGTPMIDLTGQSPGLLYIFGARSVGQPWLIGGYPGSRQFVEASLRRVGCGELSNAWLLIEPEGPRSISDNVLGVLGANIQDYTLVASWQTVPGVGGNKKVRTQLVLKPTRPPSVAKYECMLQR